MKTNLYVIVFCILLIAELVTIAMSGYLFETIFKPLLMPALMVGFIAGLKKNRSSLKKLVLTALFFSWAGDVLLIFQEKDKLYFLLGLSSFLVAHLFYIFFFHRLRMAEGIKPNPWFLLIVVIYYGGLIWLLNPFLGDMKLPVRIYGIVISFMFMLALHLLSLKNKTAGRQMMIGALLFMVSDSLLAINKFYLPFEAAGLLIMLTYGIAQLLLVYGAMNYIRSQAQVTK